MKASKKLNQKGFTIIELLIATTVFSVILLVTTATIIQIGRLYYKGIITSKTQGVARTVIDDVSRTLQFSNGQKTEQVISAQPNQPTIKVLCLGTTRYTFAEGRQVDADIGDGVYDSTNKKMRHVLWQDKIDAGECLIELPNLLSNTPDAPGHEGRELLEDNMRLQTFSANTNGQPDVYNVKVKVIYYADRDPLDDFTNPTTCKGSVVGGQWCAISDLSSVVYSRIN